MYLEVSQKKKKLKNGKITLKSSLPSLPRLRGSSWSRSAASHLVQAKIIQTKSRIFFGKPLANVPGEAGLEVGEVCDPRPGVLVRRSQGAEDAEQLVDLRVAREERALRGLRKKGMIGLNVEGGNKKNQA